MKNNLFNYATSELSQDTFICWLMSFSMIGVKKDFVGQYRLCSNYGKGNNPKGGFYAMWVYRKMGHDEWLKNDDGTWSERLSDYNFKKPGRFGSGRTMTLGVFDSDAKTFSEAIEVLHKAIKSYFDFIKEFPEVSYDKNKCK